MCLSTSSSVHSLIKERTSLQLRVGHRKWFKILPQLNSDYLHVIVLYQSNRDINTPEDISPADVLKGLCRLLSREGGVGWKFDMWPCGRDAVRIP